MLAALECGTVVQQASICQNSAWRRLFRKREYLSWGPEVRFPLSSSGPCLGSSSTVTPRNPRSPQYQTTQTSTLRPQPPHAVAFQRMFYVLQCPRPCTHTPGHTLHPNPKTPIPETLQHEGPVRSPNDIPGAPYLNRKAQNTKPLFPKGPKYL